MKQIINRIRESLKPTTLSPDILCNGLGRKHDNEQARNLWEAQYAVAMQCQNLERAMELSRARR
jgi:hypothetical protein